MEMVLEHMMRQRSVVLNGGNASDSDAYKVAVELWRSMMKRDLSSFVMRELEKRNMYPVAVSAVANMLYDAIAAYRM